MQFDDRPFDLAVVAVHSGMLQRIPDALLKVVPVATPGIGRKQVQLNFKQAFKRLSDPPRKESTHRIAVGSTLAAQQGAIAHIPVIPVDARRERQHKRQQRGYRGNCPVRKGHRDVPRVRVYVRFHGGLAGLVPLAAGACAADATGAMLAASRFL